MSFSSFSNELSSTVFIVSRRTLRRWMKEASLKRQDSPKSHCSLKRNSRNETTIEDKEHISGTKSQWKQNDTEWRSRISIFDKDRRNMRDVAFGKRYIKLNSSDNKVLWSEDACQQMLNAVLMSWMAYWTAESTSIPF